MAPRNDGGIYRFDEFRLDPVRGALLDADGTELPLRPKAYAMLQHLLDNPGRLLGREELLDALWPDVMVTDASLTQCIIRVRHALGDRAAHVLRTVPKRGYMLVAEVRRDELPRPEPASAPAPSVTVLPRHAAALREDTVAIHRFEVPGGERDCALLAEALATDLVAAGARIEGLRILPAVEAATGEVYHVQGEVRAVGTALRLTVRLEDGATGAALWAERLDQQCDGLPGLSGAALSALAAHLTQQVERHRLVLARRKPLDALSARELTLLGRDHHGRGTDEDTAVAQEMFARATAADPGYGPAYAWQAYTVQRATAHDGGSPAGQEARAEALRLARRAVQLEPDSPLCLSRLAFSLLLLHRWEEAVDAARTALDSERPALAAARNTCCMVLTAAGHPEEAVRIAQDTIALDPLCPPTTHALLGRALLLAGKAEEALAPLRWCTSRLTDDAAYGFLAVAAVETGRVPEALAARRELLRLNPGWLPSNDSAFWSFRYPEDVDRLQAAHRRLAELAAAEERGAAPDSSTVTPGTGRPPSPITQKVEMFRQDRVVVHPLEAAPANVAAARALTSDLIAELVRYEDLRVVAGPDDGLKQGFEVTGDVHAAGEHVHAVIRVSDLVTGTVFWADRVRWLSGGAAGPAVESIALLAAGVDLQIGRKSLRRARQKPADALTARELTLLGKEHYQRGTEAETTEARQLFVRAATLDPGYAAAHAWHALALARVVVHGWMIPTRRDMVEQAVGLARRAVELQPESPITLSSLANSLALQDRWEEAVTSARLALRTGWVAGDAARITAGDVLVAAGYPSEVEEALRYVIARNPHCPPLVHAALGRALLLAGRPEEALAELRLCAARLPDYATCFCTSVVAAVEAGLVEEARAALGEVRRLRPDWVAGTTPIPWFLRRPEDAGRCERAFRMAVHLDDTAKAGGLMEAPTSRT